MKHKYIDNIDEIIEFLCVDGEEEKIIRERYEQGDILVITIHKNSFGYSWK